MLAARVIKPRAVEIDFDAPVPRHWLGGNAFATHMANGVGLLFPAGERFFVRSVRRYLDRVDDDALLGEVRGFSGQEGRHAAAHEKLFRVLESQGFAVRPFLRFYEGFAYGVIEPIGLPSLRLATTVALEHFTSLLAEAALGGELFDEDTPELIRRLFLWHAVEEIEHRAVAFDVMQRARFGYIVRVVGLAIAALCLTGFWTVAVLTLLWQDRLIGRLRTAREMVEAARRYPFVVRVFVVGILQYLRPGFHPLQRDSDALADTYARSAASGISSEPVAQAPR